MGILHNLIWLLVLIGVMILVHELGHYWAARFFQVRVEVFSIGFGPALFSWRRNETEFRLAAIPLGGYVKMAGEQPGESEIDDPNSFSAKPRWQRIFIAFAGPAMNFLLAIALLAGLYMFYYPEPVGADQPAIVGYVLDDSPAAKLGLQPGDRILQFGNIENPSWEQILLEEATKVGQRIPVRIQRGDQILQLEVTPVMDEKTGIGYIGWGPKTKIRVSLVNPDSPAHRAGIQVGDIIQAVDGHPVFSTYQLRELVQKSQGRPITLQVLRDGQTIEVTVTPELSELSGEPTWLIGIAMERVIRITRLPPHQALVESVRQNVRSIFLIGSYIKGILEARLSPKSLEGPLRIAQLSGEAARQGPEAYISLMALVSLNLAVFNLLPIPILDGGMILLLLIESVLRRELSLQVKEAMLKLGLAFLLAVVVFVLYNDLVKIFQ